MQFSYLKNGGWNGFTNSIQDSMDGIKIQTASDSPYYLQYRTWNQGKSTWYSYVNSNVDDYAGAPNRPIQRLQIKVYKNDGTILKSGIVVMYRASIAGRWLPWVSNAEPEWMTGVHAKYDLGGTIDTDGYYAGNAGQNIDGIQIFVYDEETESSTGGFDGGEISSSLSYMVNDLSNWNTFDNSLVATQIDGIKIQTSTDKDYYLLYKTKNEGNTSFYSGVKSTGTAYNDYAGYPGKPIQLLDIHAYKNDGTKLTSGVIVMYRVSVDGRWLPWVSNATEKWMRDAQNKYSLDGVLSPSSSYAGNSGQNIDGVEIHIYEDDSDNPGLDSFTGVEESLSAIYMKDTASNWISFSGAATDSHIDGIHMGTDADMRFYLLYKTWNEGKSSYYPEVNSLNSESVEYAGHPGEPIQLLSISAYSQDGTKLRTGVVIMYRVRIAGRWLPWVSNANADCMQGVQRQYGLGGTLDTKSTYAGNAGQNIDGVEIHAYIGETSSSPVGPLPGIESGAATSYMVDALSSWAPFSGSIMSSHIDGIKIQTGADKPYYISYRSKNQGNSGYYPYVKSSGTAYNDYAGYPGKPIQCFGLYVYRKSDNTKLRDGVVVMYRAHVDNRWLPWVSNANPDWMVSVQSKYDLGGILDTKSTYAGNIGQNINGFEIHIFEENGTGETTHTPTGTYKIIPNVPFISQLPKFPTGCESVSTVMALNYAGVNISVDDFVDQYLDKKLSGVPFDPDTHFGGNPRGKGENGNYGCYSPVILNALSKFVNTNKWNFSGFRDKPLSELCSEYINNNIPVILWATVSMKKPTRVKNWSYLGKQIQWTSPMHCLLLIGYDETHYIFNDPLQMGPTIYYPKEAVEQAYSVMHKQAVVIQKLSTSSKPIYKYGAVEQPVTKEIYPISIIENGTSLPIDFIEELNDNEQKPTHLKKLHFSAAKFFAGLEFTNPINTTGSQTIIGNLLALALNGITAFSEAWDKLYMDIHFYKNSIGDKKAIIRCGTSEYCNTFKNWERYDEPYSLKSLHGIWSGSSVGDQIIWENKVESAAKYLYNTFSGKTASEDYLYDLEYTINSKREKDIYQSQIYFGKDGVMYEYATIYPNEKIEIVVKKHISHTTIERFDVAHLLNEVSEVPQDKKDLFDIYTIS